MTLRALIVLLCISWRSIIAVDTAANSAFLENNKQEKGVVTLSSGLQYKVLEEGPTDGTRPNSSDKCTCHYEGSLVDGSIFDSSRKRGSPATFSPSGVIKGWTEALQLMRPGDRWMLYIPSTLGYGASGTGRDIPGGATLIFDLELISVAQDTGLFAGTPLNMEVFGPLKLWHAILALLLYLGYDYVSNIGGRKVSASHILVKEKDLALLEEVKAKLSASKKPREAFAEFAHQYSTCPSSKKGGVLGTFGPGQMVPAFDKVCWSAPVGEVQGPVKTQFGYHLLLVTDRDDGEKQD